MKRFAIGIRVTLGLGLLGMIATSNPAPQNRAEIDAYAQQLFEFGAIRYVHGLDSPHIAENQSLFDQVRSGAPLDHATSCTYRRAYLMVLQDYARRFQLADDDLQMADDFGIDHANNCDGTGIAGNHDLHDLSAKANVTELLDNLEILQSGTGWVNGIILINEVQKNLVDLTVHMAPAVQSIGVQAPDFDLAGADPIAQSYRDMLGHFKDAQFADINGPPIGMALMRPSRITAISSLPRKKSSSPIAANCKGGSRGGGCHCKPSHHNWIRKLAYARSRIPQHQFAVNPRCACAQTGPPN